MKKNSLFAVLASILVCLSIIACDTFEFGQQAKDFVDNNAYGYSKRLVTADLANRWPAFFHIALVESGVTLDQISANLVNVRDMVSVAAVEDDKTAVIRLIFYDRSIETARRSEEIIDAALKRNALLENVCESRPVFDSMNLRQLARISPLESLKVPELSWKIFIGVSASTGSGPSQGNGAPSQDSGQNDGYFWATLADTITSLFDAGIYQHQQDLLHEAIRDYPNKVIQDSELFGISQSSCKSALAQEKKNIDDVRTSLEHYKAVNQEIESALRLMEQGSQAYLSPSRIKRALSTSGVLKQFQDWDNQALAGRIGRDLGLMMSEIATLKLSAADDSDCLAVLNDIEEFRDATLEAEGTLGALLPTISDPELSSRIQNRLLTLQSYSRFAKNLPDAHQLSTCRKSGPASSVRRKSLATEMQSRVSPPHRYHTVKLSQSQESGRAFSYLIPPPKHSLGYDSAGLCRGLGGRLAASCAITKVDGQNNSRLCIYGDFCIEQVPEALAEVNLNSPLLRSASFAMRSAAWKRESSEAQGTPGNAMIYSVVYRGPDTGSLNYTKAALGTAGLVLANVLRDGGYTTDSRQVGDELTAAIANMNHRVDVLDQLANSQASELKIFASKFNNTLKEHVAFADSQVPGLSEAGAELATARDSAVSAASSANGAGILKPSDQSMIDALMPKEIERKTALNIPKANVRASGASILNLTNAARDGRYVSTNPTERKVEQELRKIQTVFKKGGLPRGKYETDAAWVYAMGKLRTASAMARSGQDTAADRCIEDARSARYFSQGLIGGVVNEVTVDSAGEKLTFTNNPRAMAGSIWVAVLTTDEADSDALLGDLGVPSLSFKSKPVPDALAIRTVPGKAPNLLHGDTVDDNIKITIKYLRGQAVLNADPGILTGATFPFAKLYWFRDLVKREGPWDYKRGDKSYDYAGNFNYGATGGALGLSLEFLLRAAGMEKRRNRPEVQGNGEPWGEYPFGNEPDKQKAVEDGFIYYMQHIDDWNRLRFSPLPKRSAKR